MDLPFLPGPSGSTFAAVVLNILISILTGKTQQMHLLHYMAPGRKFWIFLPPGKFTALYERLTENPENLLTHLNDIQQKGSYCVQLPGDTVYLPFGQFHLVVTIAENFQWMCLLSVSTFISPERETRVWKLVSQGRLHRERVLRR